VSNDIITDFKKFNPKNYAINDKMSKLHWKRLFKEKYTIAYKYKLTYDGTKEKYDHDAAMEEISTGEEVLVEFEMISSKHFNGFLSREYPYTNIHIPYCKIANKNKSGIYVVMGAHCDDIMIIIKFNKIKQSFKNGKNENSRGWVDGEWKEDIFVIVDHDDTIIIEVNNLDLFKCR